ncbi:transcription factor bHLH30-like [Phalaenopsis equestris]|uniref:transcription factor bHLH30-like n=1 Tax=Phalaenopsis equestris TaxID=78828 RepID=UPI0009E55962|nr:transcription factor bHLH30-like [Phalaenopsis equestris]
MENDLGKLHPSSSSQLDSIIRYPAFHMNQESHDGSGDAFLPPIIPWQDNRSFFTSTLPPLPPPTAFYGDLYSRRLNFAYDGGFGPIGFAASDQIGLAGLYMAGGSEALLMEGGGMSSAFGELGKMTAQEILDAKALAASKSHSEAERRRRERINAHLAKLRTLLPSTTKTDKASLLAEVIQHVKELKRQTLEIAEESPLPTETDELTVDATSDENGRLILTASLCCEDRTDLLPELIKALKSLHLRTIKAEMTTLGGRFKNVLVITADDCFDSTDGNTDQQSYSVESIQDALKAVMERTAAAEEPAAGGSSKRQRTANLSSILEHRSI